MSLSNGGSASFDVAYDPNAGGPSQTVTIDGASATVYVPAPIVVTEPRRPRDHRRGQ